MNQIRLENMSEQGAREERVAPKGRNKVDFKEKEWRQENEEDRTRSRQESKSCCDRTLQQLTETAEKNLSRRWSQEIESSAKIQMKGIRQRQQFPG